MIRVQKDCGRKKATAVFFVSGQRIMPPRPEPSPNAVPPGRSSAADDPFEEFISGRRSPDDDSERRVVSAVVIDEDIDDCSDESG